MLLPFPFYFHFSSARAATATPISIKSGISDRLSPLPRDQQKGSFLTFRGESPSSFRFDSDSDTTLTRPPHRSSSSAFKPMPMIASPGEMRSADRHSSRQSESDTDNENTLTPSIRPPGERMPTTVAGIFSPHTAGYSGDRVTFRQPFKVAPLPMFQHPSSQSPRHKSESEAEHSDAGSTRSSSSNSRRNLIPRLPLYSGIEFSHHAYGGSNRNSIGAFSNISSASNNINNNSNRDSHYSGDPDGRVINNNPYHGANNYRGNNRPYSTTDDRLHSTSSSIIDNPMDSRMSSNYGNVISELETSRPVSTVSMDEFSLPPYPNVGNEDEGDNLLVVQPGYTGTDTPDRDREQDALVPRSRYESSA